ncbi:NAD(P)H-binding protein [Thiorhodococcus mannitoliphagus]|uniref:NAD(P)H-binding protein n=1 Tax=Thiorhodococcus mannitoliphagus TaxID=329406 RepID=A0A6P1E4C2_9GAMM|nr:NAD(P)H-binding protein [Thiorhodococcus mannitoliphagus]NEX23382.1 NAD(P)H-binding protein [Thiorhodococcus mannitoliphagus]
MIRSPGERPRLAIAGASGFVGTALLPRLAERFQVTALTRSPVRAAAPASIANVRWRHCDLFRASEVASSLAGMDYAVYLVHSLAPSSRLTQASPRDMDLVLADNFARAAAANGVRQILFVSGVMPQSFRFSPLPWSRREVEMVLASQGTPVTALRPSLILGPGGTGPNLLIDLVRRLPVLLLPPSSASRTRPIALPDLVRAILHCLGRPDDFSGAFDIGGAEELSYEQMLRQTSQALGLKRVILRVPLLPTPLVSLTARMISGAPTQMVGAIVESLPQDTVMQDNPLQQAIEPEALTFSEALKPCVDPLSRRPRPKPREQLLRADRALMRKEARVRSIQRVLLPPGQDAAWVSGNYFRWLGSCCWPLIRSQVDSAGDVEVWLRLPRLKLLSLRWLAHQSTADRQVYAICGGALARAGSAHARFEFQTLLDGRYTMTAIHEYAPALPWYLYIPTQALGHWLVMRRYQARLARLAR